MRTGVVLCLLVAFGPLLGTHGVPLDASTPAGRSGNALALAAEGDTLLVVNPESNSLTLIDTRDLTVVAEVPVGIDPRLVTVDDARQWAYVSNRGSDSVSVLALASQQVVAEIAVGDRPYGLALSADGSRLYVAEQGIDRIHVLDTAAARNAAGTMLNAAGMSTGHTIPVADRPSALAIGPEGKHLYVTHLLQGRVTILSLGRYRVYLPLLLRQASHTTALQLPSSSLEAPASSVDLLAPNSQSEIALWPDSNLVVSFVVAPDGKRAYVPHTRSNTANRALTFDTTVFPLVSLIDLETNSHLVGQQFDLGTLDPPGVGLPFDAAVTPDGAELWVVNAASNDISVLDLAGRSLAAHIEVGDNPRGIVISPDGATAYVNNTLAGTVSVIDTAGYRVEATVQATELPLPPALLNGKRLFHSSDDPRLANAQWIACNTCHFEGELDGRTWTFGFSGPRNTTSLLGMVETYPLRWSGEWDESADSEFAIRRENFGLGLIDGEMNCALSPPDCVHQPPNQGRSYDADSLAAFLDSLRAPLSPGHAHGEPLSEAEKRGQALYLDPALGCVDCHPPPLYTDQELHDVGTATADERIGPDYDTPTLRGLYDSAPFFHDGSAATLLEAVTRPSPGGEHDVSGPLSGREIEDLIAFLMALPFE